MQITRIKATPVNNFVVLGGIGRGDVIEGGPFRQKDDVVPVPEGPGLGVTLDRDALRFWNAHIREHGPLDHFHDPAAPERFRRLPLD